MRKDMGEHAPISKSENYAQAGLCFNDLACVRGGRMLFRGLDLSVEPGEICHVTGPNGIGKSSLIRIAAGLLRPFAGTVSISGGVALSDERLALDLHQPLTKALSYWAGHDRSAPDAVATAMAEMDLLGLADIPVRMFSTGQRKRANIARVLAMNVPIWLLDEPANGLDSASANALGQAMAAHVANGGTILAASHTDLPVTKVKTLKLADYIA